MGLKADLEAEVKKIYTDQLWTRRNGQKVPEDTDLKAGKDAASSMTPACNHLRDHINEWGPFNG